MLILHTLLHEPFTDADRLTPVLQRTRSEAIEALETVARCVIDAQPVIQPHKDAWMLTEAARRSIHRTPVDVAALKRRGVLWYVSPGPDDVVRIVKKWFIGHVRMTSGDFVAITGMTTAGTRGALERLEGDLLERGVRGGRNAHFILRPYGRFVARPDRR